MKYIKWQGDICIFKKATWIERLRHQAGFKKPILIFFPEWFEEGHYKKTKPIAIKKST